MIDDALLGGLRDGVDRVAVAGDGDERGRRGEIAIPDVMMDALEVPEAFACGCVEGEQRVGEEIVADAVASVEIKNCATGGDIEDAALGVEGHAGPVVGGTGIFPGVRGPGVVAEFTGLRDSVKAPAQRAGANVEGADIAWRGGVGFRIAATDDDEVLVDDAGSGEGDGLLLEFGVEVIAKAFAEIEAAIVGKVGNGFARRCVEGVEEVEDAGEDARTLAVGPIRKAAGGLRGAADGAVMVIDGGVEGPEQLSGGSVESDDLAQGRVSVQDASDDERVGLETTFFAGVELPCNFELGNVGAIDLGKRRVVIAVDTAVVGGPIYIGGGHRMGIPMSSGTGWAGDADSCKEDSCGDGGDEAITDTQVRFSLWRPML
jgi:hypothetical protein